MKNYQLLILWFILVTSLVYPQTEVPVSSVEKFNRRGIFENDGLKFNGKEIISDYDGNVMLQYSTPLDMLSPLSGEFTVTFNSNVEHRTMREGNHFPGYSVNTSEWILGYKGFALQTLNFERFMDMPHTDNAADPFTFRGQEVPLLIPGYHYGNYAYQLGQDKIQILRADGSKINLINTAKYNFEGLYITDKIDDAGFAIVEIINSSDPYWHRRIWFKPGDGLTYLFEEKPTTYLHDPSLLITLTKDKLPRAIYLTQIIDAEGSTLDFEYTTQLSSGETVFDTGRMAFSKIKSSKRSLDLDNGTQLEISYNRLGPSYVTIDNIVINNYNNDDWLKLNMVPTSHTFVNDRLADNSRILFVNKITDKAGRYDVIHHFDLSRLDPVVESDSLIIRKFDIPDNLSFEIESFLIKDIEYYSGKKTEFDYVTEKFEGVLGGNTSDAESFGNRLHLYANEQVILDNISLTYRDPFTNFMLKQRDVYESYPDKQVFEEIYKYKKLGGAEAIYDDFVTGIVTEVTKNNMLVGLLQIEPAMNNQSGALAEATVNNLESITTIKNYSKYKVTNYEYFISDGSSVIKLASETLKGSPSTKVENISYYDEGVRHDNPDGWTKDYFDGTFNLLENKEVRTQTGKDSLITLFNYNYQSVAFDTTVKKIISDVTIQDPQSLSVFKKYKHFLPAGTSFTSGFTDTAYFYATGLTGEEKKFSGSSVKSHVKYEYYNDTLSLLSYGKLKYVTVNPDNNPYTITNEYYNTGYYSGLPQKEINPKGLTKEYSYPASPVSDNIISGKSVRYDGSVYNINVAHKGYQSAPSQTKFIYDNNQELITKTYYDEKGNLELELDANGYLYGYEYDALGRITGAAFPYSFTGPPLGANELEQTNYSTSYTYYDSQNKVTGVSRFNNDPGNLMNVNFEFQFDALGQPLKESVNDEPKNIKRYNFLGHVEKETDGEGRDKFYYYDYLKRPVEIKYDSTSAVKQTYKYTVESGTIGGISYIEKTEFTDEEGKKTFLYFDKAGNKIAERKGSETANPTLFYYDSIYRLIKVISPDNITTDYDYDQNGNVIYKHSPDFGTYKYKFDKFNRLRYQYHTGTDELIFNNYDAFNRLLSTGTINGCSDSLYNALDAETLNAGIDDDQSKYVRVNSYDNYTVAGVFAALEYPQGFTQENLKGRLAAEAYRDKPGVAWSFKLYSYDHRGRVKEQRIVE